MARRTSYTDEDPPQLIARFLGDYTEAEGVAEDIAFAYLAWVPMSVIEPSLRTQWSSDQIARMLAAVIQREDLTDDHPNLVTEWCWANRVRNDLAHSSGQWVSGVEGAGAARAALYPDLWQLRTRTKRYTLKELPERFTVEFLLQQVIRIGGLLIALMEVSAHLGIIDLNGHSGPGPKPHLRD
jgi:hypothetical protein